VAVGAVQAQQAAAGRAIARVHHRAEHIAQRLGLRARRRGGSPAWWGQGCSAACSGALERCEGHCLAPVQGVQPAASAGSQGPTHPFPSSRLLKQGAAVHAAMRISCFLLGKLASLQAGSRRAHTPHERARPAAPAAARRA